MASILFGSCGSGNPYLAWDRRNDIISPCMSYLSAPGTTICHGTLHPKAVEGIELFNTGHFFESHEALEAAWRDESDQLRDLYRGILQVGVVYLHITRHNYPGAIKVYHRCQKWLRPWPEICLGLAVGQLRQDLEEAIAALQALGAQNIASFDLSLLKPVHYSTSENQ